METVSKKSGLDVSKMNHEIRKYGNNTEIVCRYGKDSYGTIYFIKDEISENDICRACGKRLKE